jgi:hypothetical protein
VWLLFYTWTRAAAVLPKTDQSYKDWQSICKQMELDNHNLSARVEAFDSLLDTVEEVTDRLAG